MSVPAGERDRWIHRFHPSSEGASRLVCFPHAGGAASYYHSLSQVLAPRIEVLAVQYPGRQDRRHERLIDDIGELADRICAVIPGRNEPPCAFFGHSMGATVAFEVARRLRLQHLAGPEWLFVSGRRAPSRARAGTVHLRDDRGLVAELRRLGSTDPRILSDPELLATILPATRNDYRAIETYTCPPGATVDCPITALIGDADQQTPLDDAIAWREHSTAAFDVQVLPGGHFYLDSCRPQVADSIAAALASIPDVRRSLDGRVS